MVRMAQDEDENNDKSLFVIGMLAPEQGGETKDEDKGRNTWIVQRLTTIASAIQKTGTAVLLTICSAMY